MADYPIQENLPAILSFIRNGKFDFNGKTYRFNNS